ncbi:MAG: sterol desaturase family protein [Brumimicrobium sp.]|nr:sterol desaturase family protein [Brumimicrobium sp.]
MTEIFKNNFNAYKEYFFQEIANPAWNNPFYIIPAICLLTFLLELVLPKKMNYKPLKRKGFLLDLFYVIFFDYLIMLFGFYAFTATVEYFFNLGLSAVGVESAVIFDVERLPVILQFLLLFLLLDFFQWLGHYLLHRSDFLWQFHKIHHAQEELGFASTRHFHWFEYFVFKPLLFIPFMLFNYSAMEYVTYYLIIAWTFTFFSHCNVRVNWKWVNYVFITPETHYWHHAKKTPGRFGVNFASTLTLWDHIFGFFHYPQDESEPELGVEDQHTIPKSFFGQMIHPFRTIFSKKRTTGPMTRAERRRLAKRG